MSLDFERITRDSDIEGRTEWITSNGRPFDHQCQPKQHSSVMPPI